MTTHFSSQRRTRSRAWEDHPAHDAQLLFTTDQAYPVITAGHPTEVKLVLKRVGAQLPASGPGTDRDEHGCINSAGYS